MDTIRRFFRKQGKDLEDFKRRGGRLRFVGERGHFAPDIQALLTQAEADTSGDGCMLWVALSYGGRAEILAAVRKLIVAGTLPESIDESSFGNALWTAGMPDPDIIIRTSGEKRLSGFLPWQGVYSELFFTDTLWPDFSERELDAILAEYATRERRHGK